MQNKIDFEIGAKTTIVGEVCGVDFDLRDGDVVEFIGFDERESVNDDWKEELADDFGCDVDNLRGVFLKLINDDQHVVGWCPVDVQTNNILSY